MIDLGPDNELPPMPAIPAQLAEGAAGHQTSASALTSHSSSMQGQTDPLWSGGGALPWLGNRSTVFRSRVAQITSKLAGTTENVSTSGTALQELQVELQSIQARNQALLQAATEARQTAQSQLVAANGEIEALQLAINSVLAQAAVPGADLVVPAELADLEAQQAVARAMAVQAQQSLDAATFEQRQIKIQTAQQYQYAEDAFAAKLRGLQGQIDGLAADGTNPLIISPTFSGRAGQVSTATLPGAQVILSATPATRQATDGTCGAAAAANVLAARNINVTQAEAVQLVQNTPDGSTLPNIATGLNSAFQSNPGALAGVVTPEQVAGGNVFSYTQRATLDQLSAATASGVPAVVSVRVPGAGYGHAITVDGVENGLVFYRDPWTGLAYQIPTANFTQMWTGQGVMVNTAG